MKKKIMENQRKAGEAAIASGILPWWAVLALVGNYGVTGPMKSYRHYHHCVDCGCVMICQYKECKNSGMRCPDCHQKAEQIKAFLVSKKIHSKGDIQNEYHQGQ